MPSLIARLVGNTKRPPLRGGSGRRERRTEALYDAALRLLARHDYEIVSIAALAREAHCSVGAFYGRFSDKTVFLQSVITRAFRTLTAQATHDLDPARWSGIARRTTVAALVRHIVLQMSRDQVAGATRAALKLATVKPKALEPLLAYRAAVADRAVALLAPRPSPREAAVAVQSAVQLVFAVVIDAMQQKAGPLRPGRREMIDTLGDFITPYLNRTQNAAAQDSEEGARGPSTVPRVREPKPEGSLLRPEWDEATPPPTKSPRRGRKPGDPGDTTKRPADLNPRRTNVAPPSARRRRKVQVL